MIFREVSALSRSAPRVAGTRTATRASAPKKAARRRPGAHGVDVGTITFSFASASAKGETIRLESGGIVARAWGRHNGPAGEEMSGPVRPSRKRQRRFVCRRFRLGQDRGAG